MSGRFCLLLILYAAFIFGCQSTRTLSVQPPSTPTAPPKNGDCINLPAPQVDMSQLRRDPKSPGAAIGYEGVLVVPCYDAKARYVVMNTFSISLGGSFPGASRLDDYASTRCIEGTQVVLYPTEQGWNLGDRNVLCLKHR